MTGEQLPWPAPPRDPGVWSGGPPVSPPGNTPLPPLPGAGGVVHDAHAQPNPWALQDAAATGAPGAAGAPGVAGVPGLANQPRPEAFPGLPPGRPVVVDRAPSWLLIASVVVVLALVGGAAYVVVRGGRQYPDAWDSRVAAIATWVETERELEFEHPVEVNFLSDEEYSERATEGGDITSDEQEGALDDQVAQLRALGFVAGDVDLKGASETLSDSGTLAYYDPSVEQVFVRGDEEELSPSLRVTIAHELTHVLQDQHFDLERLSEYDDGRAAVLRSLAEGDAGLVEDAYVADKLSEEDRAAYLEETAAAGESASEEIDANVPAILTTVFAAPYVLGPELVNLLEADGGWDAINEAIEDPPTEEALFDPMVYGFDAADPMTVEVAEPEGTAALDEGEFGPTTWYLMLAARVEPSRALAATDGWGGDRYVVYRDDDRVCLRVAVAFDHPDDVAEMETALRAWGESAPEGAVAIEVLDEQIRFRTCDPGPDGALPNGEIPPNLLALPVTRTQIYVQTLDSGASVAQSSCFARAVIDGFTFEQLTDAEALGAPEAQQQLQQLGANCR